MPSEPIVHVIDDDEGVRAALAFLLAGSGFAVRTYDSAMAFLDSFAGPAPGCVVTDVRMPGLSGLDLQHEMTERRITLPVIVMTGHGDVKLAVAAMKAGAVDFLEKPFDDTALLGAIRTALVRTNGHAVASGIAERLALLTPREREVLKGLVAGLPNKSIAYDLAISARTVEVHRANVMTKMGAANLPELVRMVFLARGLS